ncbi:hypothetical protein [Paraburkholderia gardini]|uniref:hypothetical protein n=1 Tax=Paraburkholderia gardini TaxID=2823469 RepID=UPI001E28B59C|nr:hypothetical protein [Paraburkholderia gardini]
MRRTHPRAAVAATPPARGGLSDVNGRDGARIPHACDFYVSLVSGVAGLLFALLLIGRLVEKPLHRFWMQRPERERNEITATDD